jgi:hypothetical protein
MTGAYLGCCDELVSHELDRFDNLLMAFFPLAPLTLDNRMDLHDLVSQAIDRPVVHGFPPHFVSVDVFF